ncbi:MAG: phosphate acyltransferase [Defluviitaleaceae bacterium]|nr:phosphate acyltransferase [Defluviitaleaceae bacterium]
MLKSFEELKKRASKLGEAKTIAIAEADEPAIEAVEEAIKEGIKVKYICAETAQEAVSLVREGKANILMKGKLQTADLLKAVLNKETGISTGRTMSHLTALSLQTYDKLLFFTDAGMNPYPTLEQKKDITQNAIAFLKDLGYSDIKIAALAAVETVNPKMPETFEAAELKYHFEAMENIYFEGPFSMDLAISKEAAEKKGISSRVSGEVDILLVPNIAVGNITCKSLIYLANATMAGIVLGAKAPIILVSRGASSSEKLMSILLALS